MRPVRSSSDSRRRVLTRRCRPMPPPTTRSANDPSPRDRDAPDRAVERAGMLRRSRRRRLRNAGWPRTRRGQQPPAVADDHPALWCRCRARRRALSRSRRIPVASSTAAASAPTWRPIAAPRTRARVHRAAAAAARAAPALSKRAAPRGTSVCERYGQHADRGHVEAEEEVASSSCRRRRPRRFAAVARQRLDCAPDSRAALQQPPRVLGVAGCAPSPGAAEALRVLEGLGGEPRAGPVAARSSAPSLTSIASPSSGPGPLAIGTSSRTLVAAAGDRGLQRAKAASRPCSVSTQRAAA